MDKSNAVGFLYRAAFGFTFNKGRAPKIVYHHESMHQKCEQAMKAALTHFISQHRTTASDIITLIKPPIFCVRLACAHLVAEVGNALLSQFLISFTYV